jgi:fructokinase|tara:strand:+ start:36264 stop:37295 length:1032 start_codon:yes stop_codon:yes gene_type:complete
MKNKTCAGTGLIALDVLIKGKSDHNPKIFAGGSCGNVLSILSYLNLNSYPIARLGNNDATDLVFEDLEKWGVNLDFIEKEEKGSTPIIIHRILESPLNEPKHRFEFRNPNNGKWLPSFRPVLAKKVDAIQNSLPKIDVFYFDRVSRSSIELAKYAKMQGALIFFEPSSNRDKKQFEECLKITDIIKFSDQRIKSYKEEYPNIQTVLEIETSGKDGLNYRFKSNKWKKLDSFSIENAVDTAGAGDWCSAGIIEQLSSEKVNNLKDFNEEIIIESLKYGQVLGAINCLYDGARGLMYQVDKLTLDKMVDLVSEKKLISEISHLMMKPTNNFENSILELDVILKSS